jgi:hypothetical protein
LAHGLFVLDLRSCFDYVVDCRRLRFFFFIKAHLVFSVAELALPDLLISLTNHFAGLHFGFTVRIEEGTTFLATLGIACSDLSLVLKS